jgi:hypothetical protein
MGDHHDLPLGQHGTGDGLAELCAERVAGRLQNRRYLVGQEEAAGEGQDLRG